MTAVEEVGARARPFDDARVLTVRSSSWEVDVLPGTGASLAAGRIRTRDGVWRDLLRPTRRTVLGDPEKCSSFPMVPWSNRIRDGVLPFGGRTWQLQRNGSDGTAIHGASRNTAWDVVERHDDRVVLELDTARQVGINFPWQFRARVTYALTGHRLTVGTSLRNTDAEPFPAGFGHHPYLQRALLPVGATPGLGTTPGLLGTTPAVGTAPALGAAPALGSGPSLGTGPGFGNPLLHVPAREGYALVGAIASGPAGAIPARANYRSPRPLGAAFVDDVVTSREPGVPVRVTYGDAGVDVDLHADPVFSHLVVYVPRRRAHFAVEPVTHVNGGFALHAAGVPGTGVFVLEPGEDRHGSFTLTVNG